ncbi:peptide chain release factor N(5)-glutamine methyltransferase [Pseudonocardia sp. HH130630-07]|uniref:peptide chain release factor N(5)-glutamine methyltransferase n=1 Tax=Pseudonocardia sp. HH130630-07 TaxID=1690815 RepID=UPI000814BDC1|nr:peptide chain release factor N(5)-glutamine methyltransferase [Pseudonocardia sp. HH130630-07]ANY05731.1 protein-(glutamine-N5) methyltransferase, release factor-specific [Pseudonocardia sp. HH130630-07]
MNRLPLRVAIAEAERVLAAAGVASPRVDAELLAAHVLDTSRSMLLMTPLVDSDLIEDLRALVARRATREPLQHILGTAVLGPVEVAVGPGVFTPRPETELLFEWGLARLTGVRRPRVLDLCTGSGALALAFAVARPDAEVHVLEADPSALSWARRNIAAHVEGGGRPVVLHAADVRWPDLLIELEGAVDLVVCNPPYVPDGTPVPPEVERWDPPGAVFGGPDGTELIGSVVRGASGWLRHGGWLAIEHDDTHGETVPALLRRRRTLGEVTEHHDLTGRPRFVTARRVPCG